MSRDEKARVRLIKAGVIKPRVRIDTEEDRIEAARQDVPFFSYYALGYAGRTDLAPHQVIWQELAQDHLVAKLEGKEGARNLCILGPSEHGKTFGLDVPFVLWILSRFWFGLHGYKGYVHGRNLRIGILGSKKDKAIAIGTVIDRLFKVRGPELAKFGLVPGYPWNSEQKYLERDEEKDVAPSIHCFGPDSEAQGDRFDVLLMTDFFTVKNNRSPELREKLLDYLDQTVYNRMEENSFILSVGHHVDNDDNYTRFEEDEDEWKVVKFKAVTEEPSQENGNQAKTLWPTKWPYEKLAKIRKQRPAVFQLMYQQEKAAKSGAVERGTFDSCLDRGRSALNYLEADLRLIYKEIDVCIDPAFSITRDAAHSACWVRGITAEGRRDVLTGWHLKLLPPQLKAKIKQTILVFLPDKIYIEANAAQILLCADVEADVKRELGEMATRVTPVYTSGTAIEETPEHFAGRIVSLLEKGLITFPYLGESARSLAENFWFQLSRFPAKPDDALKAMIIGEHGRHIESHKKVRGRILEVSLTEAVARIVHPSRGWMGESLAQKLNMFQVRR